LVADAEPLERANALIDAFWHCLKFWWHLHCDISFAMDISLGNGSHKLQLFERTFWGKFDTSSVRIWHLTLWSEVQRTRGGPRSIHEWSVDRRS
jgi:hypothetical protein